MKKSVKIFILLLAVLTLIGIVTIIGLSLFNNVREKHEKGYLASDTPKVDIYEEVKTEDKSEYKKVLEEYRGKEILIY